MHSIQQNLFSNEEILQQQNRLMIHFNSIHKCEININGGGIGGL